MDDERSGEGEFNYNTGDVYRGRWSEDRQSELGALGSLCHGRGWVAMSSWLSSF